MTFILAGGKRHSGAVEVLPPFLPKMYFPNPLAGTYREKEGGYDIPEQINEYILKPVYVPEDYEEAQTEEDYDEIIEYFYVASELEEEMACFAVEAVGQQQRQRN